MDVLLGMRAFRAVAVTGSFVAGARSLAITTAWASRLVAQLEQHLGAQLLVRTTRRSSLTDGGRLYLERCQQILGDLDEAERSLGRLQAAPRGRLRVNAPMTFGILRVAPILPELHRRYPEVELDLVLNDRLVDVVEEGFDVAVRIGARLEDSSLTARRLATGERLLCAAPAYLRARGTPRHPEELAGHRCLRYSLHAVPDRWDFVGPDGPVSVAVRGPLQINNGIALTSAALAGVGIFLAPDFMVAGHLRARRLRRILPEWLASGYGVFAVAPPTRFATPKARAFIELLERALAGGGGHAVRRSRGRALPFAAA